jgi:hypothetical protein
MIFPGWWGWTNRIPRMKSDRFIRFALLAVWDPISFVSVAVFSRRLTDGAKLYAVSLALHPPVDTWWALSTYPFLLQFLAVKTHTTKSQLAEKKSPHPYYSPLFHLFDVSRNLIAPPAVVIIYKKKSFFSLFIHFLIFCVIDVLILIPSKLIYFIRLFGRHAPYIIFKNNNINSIN